MGLAFNISRALCALAIALSGDIAPVLAQEAAARPLPQDLSLWTMFAGADAIVKIVMAGLACASVATWTIFFAKSLELRAAKRRLVAALARIDSALTLQDARQIDFDGRTVLPDFLEAAALEERLSREAKAKDGALARAASRFSEIVKAEQRVARRGLGALATIGSTAPFVGLFGTVWGIMNSFIGISKAQTTNLAVVAPGIAEALAATAMGLVAAIPAVVIYNHFVRAIAAYLDLVSRASGSASRLLSRGLAQQRGEEV